MHRQAGRAWWSILPPATATGTLVNALIAHCGDSLSGIGGVKRPGHRAPARQGHHRPDGGGQDRPRPSVAVGAVRRPRPHRRRCERGYLAFVWGAPTGPTAPSTRRSTAIRRPATSMAVRQGGREAITHWEVLRALSRHADGKPVASLIACRLGDRPHPPDPRPPRSYRPPAAGRRRPTVRASRPRPTGSWPEAQTALAAPWQAGAACLSTEHRIEHPSQGPANPDVPARNCRAILRRRLPPTAISVATGVRTTRPFARIKLPPGPPTNRL